jgi:hypothetical protein
MATTTTNFGWDIPQSTDLVKDGATAIAALGQDIDTAFVDLKGGTTGQVLAKASNTDLDYSWVAQDDSNAIQNSIVDAKGDLIAATANDTPARLAVGSNGETLVADSSTSTGLRYQPVNNGNPVINGAFDIAQRGTSVSVPASTNTATLDRFQLNVGANGASTVSQQATADTTNLPNIRYCARVQRNSGQTGTTEMFFATSMETSQSIAYAGQAVTVSFYARKGADYSSASSALKVTLRSGTGTDQNVYGYTGGASPINGSTKTLTTTWQRFEATGTVAATATELAVYFHNTPVGTAGANDYYEVTGVQLELGSIATTFKRAGGTISGELAACQRYLPAISGATNSILGFAYSTTGSQIFIKLPTTARVAPTGITVNPTLTANYALVNQGFTSGTPTAIAWNAGGTDYASINVTTTAAAPTLVAGQPVQLQTSSSNGYILFTGCEL